VQLYRYFVSQSSEFCSHNPLWCLSTSICCCLLCYQLSPETFGYTLVHWSSGDTAACILNLRTMWRCVTSFMPQPFYTWGKNPHTHLTGSCMGPRASLDAVVKRINPSSCWKLNVTHPAHTLVTILTELLRLISSTHFTSNLWKAFKIPWQGGIIHFVS
jgi:hypothetical protein